MGVGFHCPRGCSLWLGQDGAAASGRGHDRGAGVPRRTGRDPSDRAAGRAPSRASASQGLRGPSAHSAQRRDVIRLRSSEPQARGDHVATSTLSTRERRLKPVARPGREPSCDAFIARARYSMPSAMAGDRPFPHPKPCRRRRPARDRRHLDVGVGRHDLVAGGGAIPQLCRPGRFPRLHAIRRPSPARTHPWRRRRRRAAAPPPCPQRLRW